MLFMRSWFKSSRQFIGITFNDSLCSYSCVWGIKRLYIARDWLGTKKKSWTLIFGGKKKKKNQAETLFLLVSGPSRIVKKINNLEMGGNQSS